MHSLLRGKGSSILFRYRQHICLACERIINLLFLESCCVCVCLLSPVQLFVTPQTSLQGSSVRGILQARILEWVAISYSRGSSWPRDQIASPALAGRFFTTSTTWEAPWVPWRKLISLFHFPSHQNFSPLFSLNSLQNSTPRPGVLYLLFFLPLSFLQVLHNKAPKNLTMDSEPHSQGRGGYELTGPTQNPLYWSGEEEG